MKQKKSLLILCGILVVLVAAYFGSMKYNEVKEQEALEEEALLEEQNTIYITQIEEAEVVGVTWYYSGELEFTWDGEEWIYSEDTSIEIDSSYIESVISTYSNLTAYRELIDGDELSYYGLDVPLYYVTLTLETGEETTYYIGNALDSGYYVTIDDKTNVYTATSSVATVISYGVTDIIVNDTFAAVTSDMLESVTITTTDSEAVYTVDDEGAFDMIADGISVLTFYSCVDANATEETLESCLLDEENRMTWSIIYNEEDEVLESSIYIGYYDETYGTYYVQIEGSNKIYSVASDTIDMMLNQYVETEDSSTDDTYDYSYLFE